MRIVFLLCMFIAVNCSAQIGIRAYQFRPAGKLGQVFNKTFSGEILYMDNFNEKLRFRCGFSFAKLKARQDTFPIYSLKEDEYGLTVYPGYQVFEKYDMYMITVGTDYRLFEKGPLIVYPGLDILLGSPDIISETSTIVKDESFGGGELLVGIRFRVGVNLNLNDSFDLFAEFSRSIYKIQEMGNFSHNEISLGTRYQF